MEFRALGRYATSDREHVCLAECKIRALVRCHSYRSSLHLSGAGIEVRASLIFRHGRT